ncbi:MAG: hypothetical protein Q7S36_01730 [Candidatus Liptonbacteria bacterium]|nr:hypothetical protein [Candidatus Liptonbacteria bacterium]
MLRAVPKEVLESDVVRYPRGFTVVDESFPDPSPNPEELFLRKEAVALNVPGKVLEFMPEILKYPTIFPKSRRMQ